MAINPNKTDSWNFRGPWAGMGFVGVIVILVFVAAVATALFSPIHDTARTGIIVRPVYDNEAAKTVGLVNRLIAEKNNPQCDVFWNNEELRTHQLAHDG